MSPQHPTAPRRARRRALALAAAAVTALSPAVPATAAPPTARPAAGTADLGRSVVVFDPSMPVDTIQATVDRIHAQQVDAEMGGARYALLFRPGTYGTDENPLQIQVGYYTEVAGLGASPSDVVINGKVEVYNRCLADGGTANCIALVNFWRAVSNLTIDVNGTGQDGCRAGANFWAVSQAAPMRRVHVTGGPLTLMDYCTAGPQYASGGFLADSAVDGAVTNGSQQQWLTRNSRVGSWSNGVWNQVFSGVEGAPSEAGFPNPPYTTLETTPVSREKPYLFLDARGKYQVRVPAAQRNTRGTTWEDGTAPGRTIPLSEFHVATPADSAKEIDRQLARGKHLLLTPGNYTVDRTLDVERPGPVVLGLGLATLTSAKGATPLQVADVPGVVVAGVTIDAGPRLSDVLLRVGSEKGRSGREHDAAGDPTTLSDVFFRVGGPHVGRTRTALEVNSDDVLIDHTWVWRADHGIEGFTAGVNGDTDRWRTNTGLHGAVVNGDDVTATGLFVEHFQRYNTTWNGERGRVVLYQNELPYDPPTQADWSHDGVLGWAGYKVGDRVRQHRLDGGGVYAFNQNNPSIRTANGFEVPRTPGVRLRHVMTVNLTAGTIDHVVNGTGTTADDSNTGTPQYVVEYPAP